MDKQNVPWQKYSTNRNTFLINIVVSKSFFFSSSFLIFELLTYLQTPRYNYSILSKP